MKTKLTNLELKDLIKLIKHERQHFHFKKAFIKASKIPKQFFNGN